MNALGATSLASIAKANRIASLGASWRYGLIKFSWTEALCSFSKANSFEKLRLLTKQYYSKSKRAL
jgi:hypothetical protein